MPTANTVDLKTLMCTLDDTILTATDWIDLSAGTTLDVAHQSYLFECTCCCSEYFWFQRTMLYGPPNISSSFTWSSRLYFYRLEREIVTQRGMHCGIPKAMLAFLAGNSASHNSQASVQYLSSL
uniref:Uncharacterized protein n=1 Tax=Steinernema glaseri TaxID=37863 RepID=A0A1I7YK13_9BILA